MAPELHIGTRRVGADHPTYFVADIGANHDGDLERAKELIHLVAAAGADAAKFQNFTAESIVSDRGFRELGGQHSHQATWKRPVFEVYKEASLDIGWTPILKETCEQAGIEYFTSPYSAELVDAVDPYVAVYKIGSGDITWLELVEHIARKGKPVILAAGASAMPEVERAVERIRAVNDALLLMQCNTNYTGSIENFRYVNLRAIQSFAARFPGVVLGLSDHTPGHATVLGAVALGARAVEKHFTDDRSRVGPDHGFSLTPAEWREMVQRTRELEAALGDGVKRVEENERETVVLQRRAVRAARPLRTGDILERADLVVLRPCPAAAIAADAIATVCGRRLASDVDEGAALTWPDLA